MSKKKVLDNWLNQAEGVSKHQVQVWDLFKNLIPPLSKDEYMLLEQSILSEGCRESLIVWKKSSNENILIDGHNRYEICQKHGIDFGLEIKSFDNLEQAQDWVIENQLGRRTLSKEQASYLRGKKYNREKREGFKGNQYFSKGQNVHKQNTAEKIAALYNVNEKTIQRDAQFAKAIDKIGEVNPALRKEILSGATRINKSQIQEIAKMEALPHLENIQDLENLFLSKTEKATDELKAKKDFLIKCIKNSNDLMTLEQIEKFFLDSTQKF